MAKDVFLQIRLEAEDYARLQRVAKSQYLAVSTFARQAILQTVLRWEEQELPAARGEQRPRTTDHGAPKLQRVAEPQPEKPHRRRK